MPDGERLIIGDVTGVSIVNTKNFKTQTLSVCCLPGGILFANQIPNSNYLYSLGYDNILRILKEETDTTTKIGRIVEK